MGTRPALLVPLKRPGAETISRSTRLNTGKFAALKLVCALSMERVPKDVRPTGHKIPSDPRKPYAETGIEPWFYEVFGHHDARPAWNSFGLIAGTLRAL